MTGRVVTVTVSLGNPPQEFLVPHPLSAGQVRAWLDGIPDHAALRADWQDDRAGKLLTSLTAAWTETRSDLGVLEPCPSRYTDRGVTYACEIAGGPAAHPPAHPAAGTPGRIRHRGNAIDGAEPFLAAPQSWTTHPTPTAEDPRRAVDST